MSHRGFGFHSLIISDVKHLLMGLLAIYIFSLEKCLFQAFDHFFFSWVVYSLMLSCVSSLYILDINPLSDILFANTFSLSRWPFILLIVSFALQKPFSFM